MYVLGPYGFIYAVNRYTGLREIKLSYGPNKPVCFLHFIGLRIFQLLTFCIFLPNSHMNKPSASNSVHCTELWTCFRPRWIVG